MLLRGPMSRDMICSVNKENLSCSCACHGYVGVKAIDVHVSDITHGRPTTLG